MKIGLIIAAGKQRRFNTNTPKALVDIRGEPLAVRNYNMLKQVCDRVYVVVSVYNYFEFTNYDLDIINIGHSGKGSGHAIYEAINYLLFNGANVNDDVVICWGDTILTKELIDKLEFNPNTVSILARYEQQPYVKFANNKVYFRKYCDEFSDGPGYHDLSVFTSNIFYLYKGLLEFNWGYCDHNFNYIHKHGNEFEFLDVFNNTHTNYKLIETDLESYSFNTLEELEEIRRKIGD